MCINWTITFQKCGDLATKLILCEKALVEGEDACTYNEHRSIKRCCCCCREDCVSKTGCMAYIRERQAKLDSIEAKSLWEWTEGEPTSMLDVPAEGESEGLWMLWVIANKHDDCVRILAEPLPGTHEPLKDLDFS
jgi:hypothetical protein